MKPLHALVLLVLAACIRLPHVPPKARNFADAANTAVHIEVLCGDDLGPEATQPWSTAKYGSGVIISERHVLTAAHVVRCPEIPNVHVTYADGRIQRVLVEREDAGRDVARLVISSADRFHIGIAPPLLGKSFKDEKLAAWVYEDDSRRIVEGYGPEAGVFIREMATKGGDSGAPVYGEAGELVGLVSEGDGSDTIIAPVDASWLSGT